MDAAALARLEHENMIVALTALSEGATGSVIRRDGGVTLIASGLPPRMFNQVLVEDAGVGPDAIASAVNVARARGDNFVVSLRVGTDDAHLPAVSALGLVPLSEDPWLPGMVLHPATATSAVPLPEGCEIRRVTDEAGLADHVRAAAEGFEMPVEWVTAILSASLAARPDTGVYTAYAGEVPVATGVGIRTGRTIGAYAIATVEASRRRGLGAAMTMRIVEDGISAGCDVAALQASEMGRSVYERLGFRTVVEYTGYIDPEADD